MSEHPESKTESRGLLYIATGEKFVDEAVASALTFREHMPAVPIALFTDLPRRAGDGFDHVGVVENPRYGFIDKIAPLKESPFDRTVFLDTDTVAVAPVDDLFELLDRFDIAAAHAPLRERYHLPEACPSSFPELNTGVIAYRKSAAFDRLVDEWLRLYHQLIEPGKRLPPNQPSFREALYASDLRLNVLTPEYNLRTCFSFLVGGKAHVKIVHARGEAAADALAELRQPHRRSEPWVRRREDDE